MQPDPPPPPAADPNLANEQAAAQQQQVSALQDQSRGDTAALMARYGTILALSNTGVAAPPATASPDMAFR